MVWSGSRFIFGHVAPSEPDPALCAATGADLEDQRFPTRWIFSSVYKMIETMHTQLNTKKTSWGLIANSCQQLSWTAVAAKQQKKRPSVVSHANATVHTRTMSNTENDMAMLPAASLGHSTVGIVS